MSILELPIGSPLSSAHLREAPPSSVLGSPELSCVSVVGVVGTVLSAIAEVPTVPEAYRSITDTDLIRLVELTAQARGALGTIVALVAGEIARRSDPALGSSGLAQRTGYRTAVEFVKATARVTAGEAVTSVRLGTLMSVTADDGSPNPITGEITAPATPWLEPVARRMMNGELDSAAASAIAQGIGSPGPSCTIQGLRAAVEQLCRDSSGLDPDRLLARARALRGEIDLANVSIDEEHLRSRRSAKLISLPDGLGKLIWVMDPETVAVIRPIYDRLTSPKLGGVRFADGVTSDASSRSIFTDSRTADQLASDGLTELLRLGSDANPSHMLGTGAPSVKVLVTRAALDRRQGRGYLEGADRFGSAVISVATVERLACAGTTQDQQFDEHGQPLDAGRELRLFSAAQKSMLASRDGGCRFPGCDRPPSWCEAHHIEQWVRDRGRTDPHNGILLCRHHHLLLHNNGWEIERERPDDPAIGREDRYWIVPPAAVDARQVRRLMPSRSAAYDELMGAQRR